MMVIALAMLATVLLFKVMMEGAGSAGQGAPDIALPLQKGAAPTPLSAMKGKVVLLDFWATWCGPCRLSIPELEALYEKYHDQGLEVIGISLDDSHTQPMIPQAQQQLHITYPIVLAEAIPDIQGKYRFNGIPSLFIIDKHGNLRDTKEGYDPNAHLETEIVKLLNE
jgi:thiol-disulfide isomerase/thioredoxin